MDIVAELLKATKAKARAKGEDAQAYLKRLFDKANDLSDDDFKKLSEDAQKWCNTASDAVDASEALPLPDGFKDDSEKTAKGEKGGDDKSKAGKEKDKKGAKGGKGAASPGRRAAFDEDAVIKVKAKENPYRDGSLGHKMFAKYKDGMTVGAFEKAAKNIEAGRPPIEFLRYDVRKSHVEVKAK